jgi:hypothetical protein
MTKQEENDPLNLKQAVNVTYLVSSVVELAFLPFYRGHMGTHSLNLGLFTYIFILFYGGLGRAMWIATDYLPVWLAAAAWRRLTADRRQHSRYRGRIWLFRRYERLGRYAEVALLYAMGGLFEHPPSRMFFRMGAAASLIVTYVDRFTAERRALQRHDAEIEMDQYARG